MHTFLNNWVKCSSCPQDLGCKKTSKSFLGGKIVSQAYKDSAVKIFSKHFLNIIFNTKCIHTFKLEKLLKIFSSIDIIFSCFRKVTKHEEVSQRQKTF